jgi:membrane protein
MRRVLKNLKDFLLDHDLLHYASSLSFHTILALIPVLLIGFYIFSNMPIFNEAIDSLKEYIFSSIMPVNPQKISSYIDKFIENTKNLGLLGVAFVLYVSVMFFDDYEYVVNKIFNKTPRKFWHSMSLYLFITILIPVGIGASLYLSLKANLLLHSYSHTKDINILALSSYLIAWLLFMTLYKISANTDVTLKSAALSSFISSLIWFISKGLFFYYVTYNKTYSTIYGSFSTVMFFVIWIYLSWIIFLFGVKLCYFLEQKNSKTHQNQ